MGDRHRRWTPRCPSKASPPPAGADGLIPLQEKYAGWSQENWCEPKSRIHWTTGKSWFALHKCILVTVFRTWLHALRPGDVVLDWGSGCGHKVGWANQLFGVDALGVEYMRTSSRWAVRHLPGRHCHADGRNLSWVPDGSLDAVVSFGALYHLRGKEQCEVVGELVEKLRPGARAWFGHNAPYVWYSEILDDPTNFFVPNCPEDGTPTKGFEAVCAEGRNHMIPPRATWGACFAKHRKGRWGNLGIDATFFYSRDVNVWIDPRDRSFVRRKYPEHLPSYSLFVTRIATPRFQQKRRRKPTQIPTVGR